MTLDQVLQGLVQPQDEALGSRPAEVLDIESMAGHQQAAQDRCDLRVSVLKLRLARTGS